MDIAGITLKLTEIGGSYNGKVITVEVYSDKWNEILAENKLDSYSIDSIIFNNTVEDDVDIWFSGDVPLTELTNTLKLLEELTDEDTLYIGAYEEVYGIENMVELVDLIREKLYLMTFYKNNSIEDVAVSLLEDYDLPYEIMRCIDISRYCDWLQDNGYTETLYGVIVQ